MANSRPALWSFLFGVHVLTSTLVRRQSDGLESSARLVMQLRGLGEDEDGDVLAEELVYSRSSGAPWLSRQLLGHRCSVLAA